MVFQVRLNKSEIKLKYQILVDGKIYTPQQRGFEFEELIYAVLYNESLEPRTGYEPKGEQVDGSFFWNGQTFLIEAKWVKDPLPASSIYAFKGKLDGKFHTTSGVFISVNGYSKNVEDALKFGKSLNILLFDENDIPPIFNGEVTFLEVLKFKLREAGDTGSIQVPYNLKENAENISKLKPTDLYELKQFSGKHNTNSNTKYRIDDLLVFVEGKTDIPIINNLIEPIKKYYSLSYRIEALGGAGNIRQLPSLLSVYGDYKKTKAVIVVLDNDQATTDMNSLIGNIADQFQKSSIYVRPIFLFINDYLKEKLANFKLSLTELRKEFIFTELESFIKQLADDFYDPETDIVKTTLISNLEKFQWDFKRQIISGFEDDFGNSISIESLDKLIEFLNNEIIKAINGEMPLEWLKDQNDIDYEIEVREFLQDYCSDEIDKINWNSDNL